MPTFQVSHVNLRRLSSRLTLNGRPDFSLVGLNTTILDDGAIVWVTEEEANFQLFKYDATPPDGINIIQPSAGPGRWHRQTGGGIEVLDEGISLGIRTILNFVGAGVSAFPVGADQADILVPGGGGGTGFIDSAPYSCPITVAVNDAVYLTAADNVDQADATTIATMPMIGFVASKPTPITAILRYYGELSGFVGLVPGATYFVTTTPGGISDVAPVNPGEVVQKVGAARNTTTLVVMLDRDFVTL